MKQRYIRKRKQNLMFVFVYCSVIENSSRKIRQGLRHLVDFLTNKDQQ